MNYFLCLSFYCYKRELIVYYSEESLESLRHSIDIVEVLLEHNIPLKRSGSNYKCCCPFHEEKTPSFVVNPSGAYYHCYGCGVHGDAIHFLMNHAGMTFIEAIVSLSKKFGVELKLKEDDKQRNYDDITSKKEELRSINRTAEMLFRYCLYYLPEGLQAQVYLHKRGLSPDTIERFHIGYAPSSRIFLRAMQEHNISEKQLEAAGFLSKQWFLFSCRIIFPIYDALGHTIGFSSRAFLEKDNRGYKYINTPETLLFKKSKVFYGLNWSRRRIAKDRRVILVEGQVDCLQMIDAGFNCTLAPQGTAFTEDHAKELKKLGADRVYLLFDGDDAGIKAAAKAGHLCQCEGMSAHVCILPDKSDPDIFLLRQGRQALGELLDQSVTLLEFLVQQEKMRTTNMTPKETADMIRNIKSKIFKWGDSTTVIEYLKLFSSLMQTPLLPEDLFSLEAISSEKNKPTIREQPSEIKVYDKNTVMEVDIIRCWVFCGSHRRQSILDWTRQYVNERHFYNEDCLNVYKLFFESGHTEQVLLDDIQKKVQSLEVYKMISDPSFDVDNIHSILKQAVQKLLDREWLKQKIDFISMHPCLQASEREEYQKIIDSRIEVKEFV